MKALTSALPAGTLFMLILFLAILGSAVAVSWQSHEHRKLLNRLYAELSIRDAAQAEWGRLVLEQSTWTAYGRVERLAREELQMRIPEPAEVQMVQP
ncbi:cell division protein FtsL [Pseudomonas sp. NW5]|uniref:cell division protein FtsL n=1 Tax=Pseudomonas sp. NW5 TaxID=2934934 RepID=UPI0020222940|nr:cell division protein FtsL [Pseudomonas sp. NW5]MCL7461518.1 cell division protein FtsL [Pseudomonas sp. NW5]